jgi:hypothetical protein
MSSQSAPSSIIFRAWARAASNLKNREPSEKESGVIFRIPIRHGRSSFNDFPLEYNVSEGSSNGAENICLFTNNYKIKIMLLHYIASLLKYSTQKLNKY